MRVLCEVTKSIVCQGSCRGNGRYEQNTRPVIDPSLSQSKQFLQDQVSAAREISRQKSFL